MNVTYSCDFDLVLIPPDQSRWNCLAGGNWSYSTLPQCLAGKFWVLSVNKKTLINFQKNVHARINYKPFKVTFL